MATVATISIEGPVGGLPLEDVLALQEAKAKTTRLRPYHEFREEWVSEEQLNDV